MANWLRSDQRGFIDAAQGRDDHTRADVSQLHEFPYPPEDRAIAEMPFMEDIKMRESASLYRDDPLCSSLAWRRRVGCGDAVEGSKSIKNFRARGSMKDSNMKTIVGERKQQLALEFDVLASIRERNHEEHSLIGKGDRGSPFSPFTGALSSTPPSTPSLTSSKSLSSTSSVCSSSYGGRRSAHSRPQLENSSKLSHVHAVDEELYGQYIMEDAIISNQMEGSDRFCDSTTDSSGSPEPTMLDLNSLSSRSNSVEGPGSFPSRPEDSIQPPVDGRFGWLEDYGASQECINGGNRPNWFSGDLQIAMPLKLSSDMLYGTEFVQGLDHPFPSNLQLEQQPISRPLEQTPSTHPTTVHCSFPNSGFFQWDSTPHWANFEPIQPLSTQSSMVLDPVSTANPNSDTMKLYPSQKATNTTSSACSLDMSDSSPQELVTKPQPQKRKQFQCLFCDVEYTTKNAWIRHETELHESPKKWQCPDCKATFLNQAQFVRHHKQNHSCHDCNHANEAKIELPRKAAWGCGFCAAAFQSWEKRCDHVAHHFLTDGKTKSDWSFSNVITGLLAQKWVAKAWQSLIAKYHGTDVEDQPKFQWESNNPSCLELQQDLEHGQGEYEAVEETEKASRLDQLLQTAYRLGSSGSLPSPESQDTPQLCPSDSESMANMKPDKAPPSMNSKKVDYHTACDDGYASSLDECHDDDWNTDGEEDDTEFIPTESLGPSPRSPTPAKGSAGLLGSVMSGYFLDSLLNEFLKSRFGSPPGVRSLAGSDQTNTSSTSGSTEGASSGSQGNSSGRKRGFGGDNPFQRNNDEGQQGENDGDPNKRRKVISASKSGNGKKEKRFACPYFKRDPKVYGDRRSCLGPGWLEVHRVKDHLYKHHSRPTQCQRCWEEFKTEQEFARHQTSDERCPILRNQRIALGFDKEQEKQLRSKKRFDSIKTADDYWVHIYKILFPSDDKIPSPYYSMMEDSPKLAADSPGSYAQLQRFDEHIKCEFPTFLKEKLQRLEQSEIEMESEEMRTAKETIIKSLNSVFPEMVAEFFQQWQQSQEGRSSTSQPQQAPGYGAPGETQSTPLVPNPPRHGVEAFYVPAPAPLSGSVPLSAIGQALQTSKPTSDSGYYSVENSSYGHFQGFNTHVLQQQAPECTAHNTAPTRSADSDSSAMIGQSSSFESSVNQSDLGLGNESQWIFPILEDGATLGFDMLPAQGDILSIEDTSFLDLLDDVNLGFGREEQHP